MNIRTLCLLRAMPIASLLMVLSSINSAATPSPTDSIQIERLVKTAQVWGYLKYFHSEVAKGTKQWDDVLLTAISEVKVATNDAEFNAAVLKMVGSAGPMAVAATPAPNEPDSSKLNIDLSWQSDLSFDPAIRSNLDTIRTNFRFQANVYVAWGRIGLASYVNDTAYSGVGPIPSEGQRLLGLFRFWNAIEYFYPYKALLDGPWIAVLRGLIPEFMEANDTVSYHRAVFKLAASITDSHAFVLSDYPVDALHGWYYSHPGRYYLPLILRRVDNETVVYRTFDSSGVSPGDIVRAIDGIDIQTLRDSLRPYVNASNAAIIERNINYRLTRGPQGQTVKFLIENESGQKEVEITRNLPNDQWWNLHYNSGQTLQKTIGPGGDSVAIIHMGRLTVFDIRTQFDALMGMKALIFDCRNYPSFDAVLELPRRLFPGSIFTARFSRPDVYWPGLLRWSMGSIGVSPLLPQFEDSLIMIVDEETQSLAEYNVMALENRRPNAFTVGSQTSGADGDVTFVPLPGRMTVYYTGLGNWYPDGRQTQKTGITVDAEVHPTIEGLRMGKDELLERALLMASPSTSVRDGSWHPNEFRLEQNFPNPFNPSTTFTYSLGDRSRVTIRIFDILGREVALLASGVQEAGTHTATWNAAGMSSGIYFCRVFAGPLSKTIKLVLSR